MISVLAAATLAQYSSQITIGFARETSIAPPLPLSSKSTFKVSIYNGTKKSVNILGETCSWGYEMVTFEAKDPAGRTYTITRKPRGWDKNVPTPLPLESVGLVIRKISFGDGTWQGLPTKYAGQKTGWKVRVKLALKPETLLTKNAIWSGSIASGWTDATID